MADTQEHPIRYHLAEDTIDDFDIDFLLGWLSGYPRLTMGSVTQQFERKWSGWLGSDYSVFCNSGSSANLLMYYALLRSNRLELIGSHGAKKNLKVIVPSVGWVTTIAPAIQLGFEPIMCEADPDTFGLDLNHLEELLKQHHPGTVMLVQVLGVPHKMDEIMALKKDYGFVLLEDACAAMGASYHGKRVGSFGDMASFSFYFGHQISTIEGGAVSTNDPEFRDLLLMHRSHGWLKDLDPATRERIYAKYNIDPFHSPFTFVEPGFNLRPTDLQAFIGLRQIDKMEWLIEHRGANHAKYRRLLGDKFTVQTPPDDSVICSIHFGMLASTGDERRKIVTALVENGIETRIFSAGNLGRHPFWTDRYGEFRSPMADRIHEQGLFLPNHPSLTDEDIRFIAGVVLKSVR